MRSSKTSDARLTSLFLDMLAAEQGAGQNTLDAYRRDLTDLSEFLGQAFRLGPRLCAHQETPPVWAHNIRSLLILSNERITWSRSFVAVSLSP